MVLSYLNYVQLLKQKSMKVNSLTQYLASLSVISFGFMLPMAEQAQAITLGPVSNETGFLFTDLTNVEILLPQFDPMANMTMTENAVLTSVTISYFGDIRSEGSITSTASDVEDFTVTVSGQGAIDGPVNALDVIFSVPPLPDPLAVDLDAPGLGPGDTVILPLQTESSVTTLPANPIVLTSAADLAAFIGTGNVSFLGTTNVAQTISGGGGNATASLTTEANLGVTVEYEFDLVAKPDETPNVPEPASLLGLLAIGGLGLVTRRRQS